MIKITTFWKQPPPLFQPSALPSRERFHFNSPGEKIEVRFVSRHDLVRLAVFRRHVMQRVINHRARVPAICHTLHRLGIKGRASRNQFHSRPQPVQCRSRVLRRQGMFQRRQRPERFSQRMATGRPLARCQPKRLGLGMMRGLRVQERNQNAGVEENFHWSLARLRITASASSSPTSPVHISTPVFASRASLPSE